MESAGEDESSRGMMIFLGKITTDERGWSRGGRAVNGGTLRGLIRTCDELAAVRSVETLLMDACGTECPSRDETGTMPPVENGVI